MLLNYSKQQFIMIAVLFFLGMSNLSFGQFNSVDLHSDVTQVQPMTGLVFWSEDSSNGLNTLDNEVQLEFSYLVYSEIVQNEGIYNWNRVDELLENAAANNRQMIIRFRYTYPGKIEPSVPDYIRSMDEWYEGDQDKEIHTVEGKPTYVPDWSSEALEDFTKEFFTAFAAEYDDDPRLAFLQIGFGSYSEYHLYNEAGPILELGNNFPSKSYQNEFLIHVNGLFQETQWGISIDAANSDYTPIANSVALQNLNYGLFDDSFLHENHSNDDLEYEYNRESWLFFGADKYETSVAGGELNYYSDYDQQNALEPNGPWETSFEELAERYHISYMIGNDQLDYQTASRIESAGRATGYRFSVESYQTNGSTTNVTIKNNGIAPIYYDAYPAVGGIRSSNSLRGLLPGQSRNFTISRGAVGDDLQIQCDRLSPGQVIQFDADIDADNGNGNNDCELLANSNFDNNLQPNWENWQCNVAAVNGIATITNISDVADPWLAGFKMENIVLEQGESYTFEFRASADANRSILVKVGKNTDPWPDYIFETIELTSDMKNFTIDFTMPQSTSNDNSVNFFIGGNQTNVYIDNASLQKTDCDGGGNNSQSAYPSGVPHSIPGTINATHYDEGGQDIAYYDNTEGNRGNHIRQDEDVDTHLFANSPDGIVGWITNGEWLEFTVDVQEPGEYTVAYEVAAANSNGQFRLEYDGGVTDDINVASTGGGAAFKPIKSKNVSLSPGVQVIRLYFIKGGFNIRNITFNIQSPYKTHNIPGTINATEYDKGGQGIGYNDITKDNKGNGIRQDEFVDTHVFGNSPDGVVAWIANGEWLEFTVDVQTQGEYTVAYEVAAANSNGQFRLEYDGGVTDDINVASTGGGAAFKTIESNNVSLSPGVQVIRLYFIKGGFNIRNININVQSPYKTHNIPGTLNASEYDNGGQGIGYYDTTKDNRGNGIRQDESADTHKYNNSPDHIVGWIANGEWLEFTVNVQTQGEYAVAYEVASKNSNGQFKLEYDGGVTDDVSVASTGNWALFTPIQSNNISLNSGQQVIRLYFTKAGFNIRNITFELVGASEASDVVVMRKRNAMGYAIDGGGSGANGQNVNIRNYNPNDVNQQWVEIDRGNGYYSYQKKNTNYCIDGNNEGSNGQNVYLWTCNDNNQNQHWKKIPVGGNAYRLEKRNASTYSIDGNNGGSDGQNTYLWSNGNNNQNQHWVFEVVGQAKVEQTQDVDLHVYPNPFSSELTVELPTDLESDAMSVQLIDITGKVVYEKTQLNAGQTIQIREELPNGFYMLKWSDEKSRMSATRKVIKQ